MPQEVHVSPVRLTAHADLQIEPGFVLPAGVYDGQERKVIFVGFKGHPWLDPTYYVELRAEELASMGAKVERNLYSEVINLTDFVQWGDIGVSAPAL